MDEIDATLSRRWRMRSRLCARNSRTTQLSRRFITFRSALVWARTKRVCVCGMTDLCIVFRHWHTCLLVRCHFSPWPWLTFFTRLLFFFFTPESLWNSLGCCYSILDALIARSLPKTWHVVRFRSEQVRPLHIEGHLAVGEAFFLILSSWRKFIIMLFWECAWVIYWPKACCMFF